MKDFCLTNGWFEVLAGLYGSEIVVMDKTIDNDKNHRMHDIMKVYVR
jgi:hypothetical protein